LWGKGEFNTPKIGKVEDPQTGDYMLTAENEGYNLAKEVRLRKENELVHRVIHPLFDKTEEQLREHDSNILKEAEDQKGRTRELAGFGTPAETGGSDDSTGVVIVYGSAKKRRFKIFTRGNMGKKKYVGWSEKGIDKMERLVKEIRLDRGEDPRNGRGNERQVLELGEGILCVDNLVCWWAQFKQERKGPTASQGT
jgi:hypothetical protein